MILVLDDTLEVIADGVGVTEGLACLIHEVRHWQVVTIYTRVIGRNTIVASVIIVVVLQTELGLELEVLEDLPCERTVQVEGLTLLVTVVVARRYQWGS